MDGVIGIAKCTICSHYWVSFVW